MAEATNAASARDHLLSKLVAKVLSEVHGLQPLVCFAAHLEHI